MGKGELAHLARRVGALRRPVPERRPEPVRHGVDLQLVQQVGHVGVGQRAAGGRGEDGAGAGRQPPRLVEDGKRARRERHAVLAPGLHASGGDRPHRALAVELLPARVADLARARGGEHQELEREHRAGVGARFAHPRERRAHLGVRQGAVVAARSGVARQRGRERVAGGVVGAVALGDGPLHHRADALAHGARGVALGEPDRQQHVHDVGAGDGVDGHGAEPGQHVVAQGCAPAMLGPAVGLPAPGVDRDDRLARFGEGRCGARGPARIAALGDGAGVLERPLAGHRQGDHRVAAEADAGGLAAEAHALRPGLGEAAARGGLDEQAQAEAAAPVAVAAGEVDVSDEGGGEHSGAILHDWLLLRVRMVYEKECAAGTREEPITSLLS